MKTLLAFALLAITSASVWAGNDALHSWTDLQGRTLQASFVKADATTVTIKWNGKVVSIPLATLSPASQALARRLSQAAAPPTVGMHSWTDTQGRTLQAVFLKSDGVMVTLNWNGRVVPIPLATLSPASQKLARELASAKATPSKPSSPPPPTLEPTPADGELSLDAEHK